MRTLVISQPTYLPWLGYFRIMKEADVYVFLDNVQFEPRSWQIRNRIKVPSKEIFLSIPTHHTLQSRISEVSIDNSKDWAKQHWNALRLSYGKAKFFKYYAPFFEAVYRQKWTKLVHLNITLIKYLAQQLGINPIFVQASKMNLESKRTDLLEEICRKFNADRYVSSIGAHQYMRNDGAQKLFEEARITVDFLQYNTPDYPQLFGNFIPNLSTIDCLFNCGLDAQEIMKKAEASTFYRLGSEIKSDKLYIP